MNITLTDGFFITTDAHNYELHDGSVSHYYRTLENALDGYAEYVRKKRTNSFDGKISKYLDEIKRVNRETTQKLKQELESKGVS